MAVASPQLGWMMFKDGKPHDHGLCESKRSLLIGYDMMPLRGLEQTEEVLRKKGIVACEAEVSIVAEGEQDCYAATIDGRFSLAMLEYSICAHVKEHVVKGVASFLGRDSRGFTRDKDGLLSREEQETCHHYWLFMLGAYKDGRRKSTYRKLQQEISAIFASKHIEIVPIKYVPLKEQGAGDEDGN
jgi:hypothetical protein